MSRSSPREDGPGALEAVTTESPDLVVLDIGLPGKTAHAEEESRRRADEGGPDAFITKPFQPSDFRDTVLDLVR